MNETSKHHKAEEVVYHNGMPPMGVQDTPANAHQKAEALEGVAHGITLPNQEDVSVGAPGCQHCEVVPLPMRGPGTVILRFPHTHSLGKVLLLLEDSPWPHREAEGTLSIEVGRGSLAPVLSPIVEVLSPPEQRDTRAMFQPQGHLLQAKDFFEIESLPEFVTRARSDWLLDILRQKRLFSIFQPIVMRQIKGNGRPVYGYECLMRAQVDGEMVTPSSMINLARSAGLIFQLDLAARRAAITGAAQHKIQEKIFVNFAPNSIYDPYSCLDSTLRLIDELGFAREQIVFEIVESERLPEGKHLKRIVNYYRENGFGVALDDVGSGFASLHTLLDLRPDYVKLDMGLTRGVHLDKTKAVVARKLIETIRELELMAVAEGIECEGERDWVEEHGADLMQGFLFARPAVPPPAL